MDLKSSSYMRVSCRVVFIDILLKIDIGAIISCIYSFCFSSALTSRQDESDDHTSDLFFRDSNFDYFRCKFIEN